MSKTVVITGASEGIGRALALVFARRQFRLILVARTESRLNSLLEELATQAKGRATSDHRTIVADLSSTKGCELLVEALKGESSLHGWVNNAGFGDLTPFEQAPFSKWDLMINLNIRALTYFSHYFLNRAERGSFLVQISSTLSFLPMPVQAVYAATKAFVTSFSESLWYQQKSRGIHVVAFCPGVTWTQFNRRAGGNPDDFPRWLGQTPEAVAARIVRAIDRKQGPTVISGWPNVVGVFISRLLSRAALLKRMGRLQN